MAYVSLYRKYRSQTFAEVLGQEHVTRTLSQAIVEDRLSHAYLFTGPRGTGKTSTARILAKAVNCERGPTPEPCGVCGQCVAITNGSSVDVIEIDAASHGGVDDVRDLRDRVAFAPASARKKVYIVDECHMLSTAGWNAFLKTVEEPPGHVIFVFATTEPHKVLETILSRTQRFDFRRMGGDVLADHVADVGTREGLTFEPGAIDLVVRAGDGSARDTLSVLDQVVAFTGATVTLRGVTDVLGAVPDELLVEAADLLAAGDVAGVCVLVGRLADAGHDLRAFARDTVEHLRQLFLLQVAPAAGLVETTPERLARLQAQAGRLGRVELLRAVELLAEAQAQMRRGNTRLPLEIALVKAALPEACGDPAALAARLDRLERRTGVGVAAAGAADLPGVGGSDADGLPGVGGVGADGSPGAGMVGADGPPRGRGVGAGDPPATPEAPAADTSEPPAPVPPEDSAAESAERADPSEATQAPAQDLDAAPPTSPVGPADPGGSFDRESEPTGSGTPDAPLAVARAVDLELVQRSWDAVRETVKRRKRSLDAWLMMGRPVGVRDTTVELAFQSRYAFHADNCASEDSQRLLGDVFDEVLGVRLRVVCTLVDGDDDLVAAVAGDAPSLDDQAAAVLESEAASAAGDLPDETKAHDMAVRTLTRDLGATIVDDQ